MAKKSTCHPDRPHYGKGLCKLCWHKQYVAERRNELNEKKRKRYAEIPETKQKMKESAWKHQIKRLYGLSYEEYKLIHIQQEGKCALCKKSEMHRHLAVDHDHETGKVRGLLCQPCNSMLGYFENIEWKNEAIAYLIRHQFPHGHPAFTRRIVNEADLHSKKNFDYASGGNPLGNFLRVSKILQQYPGLQLSDPAVVAAVYMLKQLDAYFWIKSNKIETKSEGIQERLGDVSVYSKIIAIIEQEGGKNG